MKEIKALVCIIIFFSANFLFADSPLTSTPFHEKYTDVDIVLEAEQSGTINRKIADYLHDVNNPVDIKAAVINALGWDINGKNNAREYTMIIYNSYVISDDMISASTDEAFVLGYLHAMDNYQDPDYALQYLKVAQQSNSKSYTVNLIYRLVKAQKAMDTDFCKAWNQVNKVYLDDDLNIDMREEARKVIYDYMINYKGYCK
ncbi:MAG TPA: hypothetical protein PKA90_09190 [Ignavibacteria bacterium]|nr:hypothetical protein [Ignavibacteria bacterium]HMR40590.1 hypothetical protein [Ignavibacteria bacterium]